MEGWGDGLGGGMIGGFWGWRGEIVMGFGVLYLILKVCEWGGGYVCL